MAEPFGRRQPLGEPGAGLPALPGSPARLHGAARGLRRGAPVERRRRPRGDGAASREARGTQAALDRLGLQLPEPRSRLLRRCPLRRLRRGRPAGSGGGARARSRQLRRGDRHQPLRRLCRLLGLQRFRMRNRQACPDGQRAGPFPRDPRSALAGLQPAPHQALRHGRGRSCRGACRGRGGDLRPRQLCHRTDRRRPAALVPERQAVGSSRRRSCSTGSRPWATGGRATWCSASA